MTIGRAVFSVAGALVAAGIVFAASANPRLVGQQQHACVAPEHRQFDFWVGDWDVRAVGSTQAGARNVITSILGGCAILESYTTDGAYAGFSHNIYDRARGVWHQTWVDNSGLLLQLDGGIVEGNMVLEGPGKDAEGHPIMNKITWTPHDDGTVQQTWLTSNDDGETWTTAFDGIYSKR